MHEQLFSHVDEPTALDVLAKLRINYDPERAREHGAEAVEGHWHAGSGTTVIGREGPGPPEHGGAWETACRVVGEYEFTDARILRGVYRRDSELLGRNMLLEARFFGLRFYLRVRITEVVDEERDTDDGPQRLWGWWYQTLDGHLEQSRLGYEVIKNLRGWSRSASPDTRGARPSRTRSSGGDSCSSAGGHSNASIRASRHGWLTWCERRSVAGGFRRPRHARTASCSRHPACGRTRLNTSPAHGSTPGS